MASPPRSLRAAVTALCRGSTTISLCSLLAAHFFVAASPAWGQAAPAGITDERLRQYIEQSRTAATARLPAEVVAQRVQARARLLAQGEAALRNGDTAQAQTAFDKAATYEHAADTEMALVRTYMQAGNYRQATSFGAHTAGAHRQVVAGAVLYGWLLSLGGQDVVAKKLLETAAQTFPNDAQVRTVRQLLDSGSGSPTGDLRKPPVRLAPYATGDRVAASASPVASGVLVHSGRHAWVPLSLLGTRSAAPKLWVRNGLGQTRLAAVYQRFPELGLALLHWPQALPLSAAAAMPARDAFPGSPGYAVAYIPAADADAAWPRLSTGLQGMPVGNVPGLRQLGMTLPAGSQGAAVLDGAGQVVGIALPGPGGKDQVVMASLLRPALGKLAPTPPTAAAAAPIAAGRLPIDEVYENALRISLQVLAKP
ncbi:MAG: hypothetical protein ACKVOO_04890 [Burkholderiaceae bacterium]